MKALVVVLALAIGAARADGPPQTPPAESHGVLVEGQRVDLGAKGIRLVPSGGAVYMEKPSWDYVLSAREYEKARANAAVEVAKSERMKGFFVGAGIGVVVGLVAGAVVVLAAK